MLPLQSYFVRLRDHWHGIKCNKNYFLCSSNVLLPPPRCIILLTVVFISEEDLISMYNNAIKKLTTTTTILKFICCLKRIRLLCLEELNKFHPLLITWNNITIAQNYSKKVVVIKYDYELHAIIAYWYSQDFKLK